LKFVLLNTHEIFPSHISGGIEKRIEAFVKFCIKEAIELKILSSKRIQFDNTLKDFLVPYAHILSSSQEDFVNKAIPFIEKDEKVISYNLSNDSCTALNNSNIRVINANCGGLAKEQRPSGFIYSSNLISNRFLSLNQKLSYNSYYDESTTCVIPHGLSDEEYYFNPAQQNKQYFLWCASLGWGLKPKGLDLFISLAKLNPNDKFVAYGSKWNSENLENFLKDLKVPNLEIKFNLNDEDKNLVFSNAIALCQFTRLIESCNITTLESYSRGTPVITLNEDQGGVTNNAKFFDLTLSSYEDFQNLKNKALTINRQEIFDFYKNKFHCRNEYNLLTEEFNK
jgi:glycosyltransferase involved in cell wall biosynthesis